MHRGVCTNASNRGIGDTSRRLRLSQIRWQNRQYAHTDRTSLQIGTFSTPRYAPGSAPNARAGVDLARIGIAKLSLIDPFASDPFLRFLDSAPVEDEPVTPEEEAAVAEVESDRAAGVPTLPFDDVKRAHTES